MKPGQVETPQVTPRERDEALAVLRDLFGEPPADMLALAEQRWETLNAK